MDNSSSLISLEQLHHYDRQSSTIDMLAPFLVALHQLQQLLIIAFVGLYLFFFGLISVSVTIIFLVITACMKYLNIQDIKMEKATVKFDFFLLLRITIRQIICYMVCRGELHNLHISECSTHPHFHFGFCLLQTFRD